MSGTMPKDDKVIIEMPEADGDPMEAVPSDTEVERGTGEKGETEDAPRESD